MRWYHMKLLYIVVQVNIFPVATQLADISQMLTVFLY